MSFLTWIVSTHVMHQLIAEIESFNFNFPMNQLLNEGVVFQYLGVKLFLSKKKDI